MSLEIKKFTAEDILTMYPEMKQDERVIQAAKFNQVAGPGYTAFIKNEPIVCAGLRVYGVAEGWAYFSSLIQGKHLSERISVLRAMLEHLETLQREHNVWHIWAEANKINDIGCSSQLQREDLLRFLGFRKVDNTYLK